MLRAGRPGDLGRDERHRGGGRPADAERRRAQDAETRATVKDREAQAARENATNSQLVIITNRIDTAKGALEAAKAVGVEYYFIEDETAAPLQNIPVSVRYLQTFKY